MKRSGWLLVGWLAGWGLAADAATSYTWTNRVNGGSGYWTNATLWSPTSGTPGGATLDAAYLTNTFAGTYTNILNATPANWLNRVVVSNTLGQAWLVLTNASMTATGQFTVGNGGRVRVDAGSFLTVSNSFNLQGTNATLLVNAGGVVTGMAPFAAGANTSSTGVTGLVFSTSVGGGGTLTLGSIGTLFVGQNAGCNFNSLTISNVTFSTGASTIVGHMNPQRVALVSTNVNSFLRITGSNTLFTSQGIIIGNSQGGTNNAGSASYNIVTNHQLVVEYGAVVTNRSTLRVGYAFMTDTDASTLSISNLFNRVVVNNATWTNNGNVIIGHAAASALATFVANFNSLVISNGATFVTPGAVTVGWRESTAAGSRANSNSLVIASGALVNIGSNLTVGAGGGVGNFVQISGASTTVTVTRVDVSAASRLDLLGGTLRVTDSIVVSNPAPQVAGNGVTPTVLQLATTAPNYFAGGLVITNAATLQGAGAIANAVTVTGGGTLAPGNSPGQFLIAGPLTLQTNSTLVIELGGSPLNPGVDFDQLVADGLTLGGGVLAGSLLSSLAVGDTFVIISNTSAAVWNGTDQFAGLTNGATVVWGGTPLEIRYDHVAGPDAVANDVALTVIPEPSAWVLVAAGLLFGFGWLWPGRGRSRA